MGEESRLESASGAGGLGPKTGFSVWIGGRARQREYWAWAAPWSIATMIVAMVAPGAEIVLGPVMLCVWIRRLHDLGLTGWLAPLINVAIGIVGWMETGILTAGDDGGIMSGLAAIAALIALGSIPGQPRKNAFGHPRGHRGVDVAETFS